MSSGAERDRTPPDPRLRLPVGLRPEADYTLEMEGRRMMNDGRALIEGLDEIWRGLPKPAGV
jgi:hypothetical protein